MLIETRTRMTAFLLLTSWSHWFINFVSAHISHTWSSFLTMKIDLLKIVTLWRLHSLADSRWAKCQCQSLYVLIFWSLRSAWSQLFSSAELWFDILSIENLWLQLWSVSAFQTHRSELMSSLIWLDRATSDSHCWHIAESANSLRSFVMCLTMYISSCSHASIMILSCLSCMYSLCWSKLPCSFFSHIHFSDSKLISSFET